MLLRSSTQKLSKQHMASKINHNRSVMSAWKESLMVHDFLVSQLIYNQGMSVRVFINLSIIVYLSLFLSLCSCTLCTFSVFVCLSVCMSVCLSVCQFLCLSVSFYVYLFVCLSICLSVCLLVCLFVYLFVCLSICLSVCLSVLFPESFDII